MTMGCKHIGWLGTLYPLFGWSQGGRVARELGLRIGDRFLTHKHKHIRFLPFFNTTHNFGTKSCTYIHIGTPA